MSSETQQRVVIGIDPDVTASGIGIVRICGADVTVELMRAPFAEAIEAIAEAVKDVDHMVFVEAGWLNSGNWHLNYHDSKAVAAAKGRAAGRNHQIGLDICAMLDFRGIAHTPVKPLRKRWQGADRKIRHDELDAIVKGVNQSGLPRRRSNQEERDALLLALEHSSLLPRPGKRPKR